MTSGLLGYDRKIARKKKRGEDLYRSAAKTLKPRLKKKLLEKTTWYKDRKRDDEEYDGKKSQKMGCKGGRVRDDRKKKKKGKGIVKAVLFVPYTHGSRLAKRLREAEMKLEELTGYRLKIVERGGRRLEDMLKLK